MWVGTGRASVKAKFVGTRGSKMNGKADVSVTEQGEELSFYQSHRNEPVPPDPSIISAVKYTPAMTPTYKSNLPKYMELGKPVGPGGRNISVDVHRKDNNIPTYNLFGPIICENQPKGTLAKNEIQPKAVDGGKSESLGTVYDLKEKLGVSVESAAVDQVGSKLSELTVTASESSGSLHSLLIPKKFRQAEEEELEIEENGGRSRTADVFYDDSPPEKANKVISKYSERKVHGSVPSRGWKAILSSNRFRISSGEERSETDRSGNDTDNDRKGPAVFGISNDRRPPLNMNLKITNVDDPHSFMIVNVDAKKQNELDFLRKEMFTWCASTEGQKTLADQPNKSFRKRGYYGLYIPQLKTCARTQFLHLLKNSDDAYVFRIDEGEEERVSTKLLVPLKPKWKDLEQLSCHAQIEGVYDEVEAKNFRLKYENKTVRMTLAEVFPKTKTCAGIAVRVKCCRVCICEDRIDNGTF